MVQPLGTYGLFSAARERLEHGLSHHFSLGFSVNPTLEFTTALMRSPLSTYVIHAGIPGATNTRVGSIAFDPEHVSYRLFIADSHIESIARDILDPLFAGRDA